MRNLTISLICLALACGSISVRSQDVVKAAVNEATRAGFSELERQMIKKYLGDAYENEDSAGGNKGGKGGKGLPPGLAKRESLPPGLAAQLQRNGTLPPGLAKRDLPDDLRRQLPPVQEGYERSILEDMTVVLIEKATGRIADIIKDAVTDNDRPM